MGKLIMNKLFTSSATFKVTAAMHKLVFIAVGGGGNGAVEHSGGGGGCAVLFINNPLPNMEYSFTIGGVGGNTLISWSRDFLGVSNSASSITAYGGENATSSAHGAGGTATGGDINSTGGTGNTTAGGGAGSPFGDSVAGGDMFMIEEYALAYEQMLKHHLLNCGYTWPQTPPNPWTGSYYNTDSGIWIPAFRGDSSDTNAGRLAGFLGKGSYGLTTVNNEQVASFRPAGFGSAEGKSSSTDRVNGIASGFGRRSKAQTWEKGVRSGTLVSGFGGGGGYNNNSSEGYWHNGVNGGYGGGGGGCKDPDATPGTGGSGAILVLIETDDMLCIPYL